MFLPTSPRPPSGITRSTPSLTSPQAYGAPWSPETAWLRPLGRDGVGGAPSRLERRPASCRPRSTLSPVMAKRRDRPGLQTSSSGQTWQVRLPDGRTLGMPGAQAAVCCFCGLELGDDGAERVLLTACWQDGRGRADAELERPPRLCRRASCLPSRARPGRAARAARGSRARARARRRSAGSAAGGSRRPRGRAGSSAALIGIGLLVIFSRS